jgi:uncharacterized protein YukE
MSASLPTVVRADTGACRSTASWLSEVAKSADDASRMADRARQDMESAWTGLAANTCQDELAERSQAADHVSQSARLVMSALDRFADAIDGVRAAMAPARREAVQAGLVITADAILVPATSTATTSAISAPSVATVSRMVADARATERQAHDDLEGSLERLTSFLDYFGQSMRLRLVSIAKSAFVLAPLDGKVPYDKLAASVKGAQQVLSANVKVANRVPLPYSSVALAGVGIGMSIADGESPKKAIVSGGATLAASTLASYGADAALTVAIGAGPPGWVAVGVGLAVSAGVGYLINHHWNTINHLL